MSGRVLTSALSWAGMGSIVPSLLALPECDGNKQLADLGLFLAQVTCASGAGLSSSSSPQEVAWAAVHWATVGDMGRESRTSSETSARSEHISRLLAFHGPEQVTCQAWLSGTEEWLGMDDSSSLQWVLRAVSSGLTYRVPVMLS